MVEPRLPHSMQVMRALRRMLLERRGEWLNEGHITAEGSSWHDPLHVSWTPERVRGLLEQSLNDTSDHYATMVRPEAFLSVTSDRGRSWDIINDESFPLDADKLRRLSVWDTPYLRTQGGAGGKIRNIAHEGRHRATAMGIAGARRIPIVIKHERAKTTPLLDDRAVRIAPDYLGESEIGSSRLIPLIPERFDEIVRMGKPKRSDARHIAYAIPLLAALRAALGKRDGDA